MSIHAIPILTTWYSLLGIVLYGFIALGMSISPTIIYSRFGLIVKDSYVCISILLSVFLCIVLLIVDIDHPFEIILFYTFLVSSLLYPSLLLVLAAVQKVRNDPLRGQKVLESLRQHLENNNEPEIENHLKLLHRCDETDEKIIMQTLCDRRPSIRRAAADTGRQLGIDPDVVSCVKGNHSDFEKLAALQDERIAPHIIAHVDYLLGKAEQKTGKKRVQILLGALACLKKIEIDAATKLRILKLYETSNHKIKTSFLKQLHTTDENKAEIYAALLKISNEKSAMHVAEKLWASAKTEDIGGACWEECRKAFWERFYMLSAKDLCSNKSGVRKGAAILASMFSGSDFFTEKIKGDPSDFENIALHSEPWLVRNLLSHLKSNHDTAFYAAVQGVTALIESGMVPAALIQWLDGKETGNNNAPVTAPQVPVSAEIIDKLREKIGGRVEKGLLHKSAPIRILMVRTAKALGMKLDFLEMITGEESDFQRIAETADSQLQEKLINIVQSGGSQTLAIIRGLIHCWTRDGALSENGQQSLPFLARDAGSNVIDLVVDALIDLKDPSPIAGLLTNHGERVAHRVSKSLLMVETQATEAFGKDGWALLKSLLPKKQAIVKEGQYPHLKEHHFNPNLVDSSSIQPSGGGDANFQMAIDAINKSDSGGAEKLFRNAIDKGLDDLRAGYARANIGQICLRRKNLTEAVRMFESVLEANRVLYESAHEAAGYLSEIYRALGRSEEVAGLQRITTQTTTKLGISLDPDVAAQIRDLVKKQAQKNAAASTDKLIKKSVKELVAECEWHINNADRYETLKHEFNRREKDIVRPIGIKLNQTGGMKLMRKVYGEVEKKIYQKYQKSCSSALEMKWSRIGEWR